MMFDNVDDSVFEVMAKEGSNGNSHASTKPPPTPSPLRSAKFFQVSFLFFFLP